MIVVRHARSVVDPTTPPADWVLAPGATDAAQALGRQLRERTTTAVVASDERKAIDTALALELLPVGTYAGFREVERPWYDGPDALAQAAARWFAGETVSGWEERAAAIDRFARGVDELPRDGLVIVTHGTVMTAWLHALGYTDDPFAFWSDLRMPDAWEVGHTLVRCQAPA